MAKFTALLRKSPSFIRPPAGVPDPAFCDAVEVEAECVEHVFARLNHGSGEEVPGYNGRSFSVGDAVVDGEGNVHLCLSMGWEVVGKMPPTSAPDTLASLDAKLTLARAALKKRVGSPRNAFEALRTDLLPEAKLVNEIERAMLKLVDA